MASPFALPAPSGLGRPTGGSLSARDRARALYSGTGDRLRATGAAIQGYGSRAGGFVARKSQEDTVGGLFAQTLGASTAVGALGALDASPAGDWIREKTAGLAEPSTVVAAVAVTARAFGVDKRFMPKAVVDANSAVIRGILPVLAYKTGQRIPGAIANRTGGAAGGDVSVSGTPEASNPPTDAPPPASSAGAPEPEPIPGEATVA